MTENDTIRVYDENSQEWIKNRTPEFLDRLDSFASRNMPKPATKGSNRNISIDLGCGPGWHTDRLPTPFVALDASLSMLKAASKISPSALRVAADLKFLPFASKSISLGWASKSYIHIPASELPLALGELHRVMKEDSEVEICFFQGDQEFDHIDGDDFPGRRFALWEPEKLSFVIEGAGFRIQSLDIYKSGRNTLFFSLKRLRSLADTVNANMDILVCGLNPSLHAAETGVGFGAPSNRFWKAALESGIASFDRDPLAALLKDKMGMTDLVKRATRSIDEIKAGEYKDGFLRLQSLVKWLKPKIVCIVGITSWRHIFGKEVKTGLQPKTLAGQPVYVMPSTSGRNAGSSLKDLTLHLKKVQKLTGK